MTRDVWLIVLGSILAFLGGVVAFFVQWFWNRKVQRAIVSDFLKELLRAFDRVCPRIFETFEKSGILWNDLLTQISNDLALYERNREHSIVLKDLSLRAELWDWFSRLRTVISMSVGLNALISNNRNTQWAHGQIKEQVEALKELRVEAQRLLQKLS